MSDRKPILVTGGAGFIGANLCKALSTAGRYDVTVIDDLATGLESNLDDVDVDFVKGSILDRDLLSDVTRPGTTVIHLAACQYVAAVVQGYSADVRELLGELSSDDETHLDDDDSNSTVNARDDAAD